MGFNYKILNNLLKQFSILDKIFESIEVMSDSTNLLSIIIKENPKNLENPAIFCVVNSKMSLQCMI